MPSFSTGDGGKRHGLVFPLRDNQRLVPFSPPPQRRKVFTVYTVIRSIEVGLMARIDLFAKIPLIGMSLVFLAMFIVAVTAYLHAGWYSIIGYAIAAVVAVAGFVMTFRDVRDTPGPPEHWDARGNPVDDPASPGN